jgi:hypothetical protein
VLDYGIGEPCRKRNFLFGLDYANPYDEGGKSRTEMWYTVIGYAGPETRITMLTKVNTKVGQSCS